MIPWYLWALAVALCVLIGVLLGGCATRGPYWVHVAAPVAVRSVVYVDAPCGHADWGGCAVRSAGRIELKRGMSAARMACTYTHEKRHLEQGDDHPEFDSSDAFDKFASDCGDGTML